MFNAFISYSHAVDGKLAPALEIALQRFGIPWWKSRTLNIFRDETSLSASPHLWSNITIALDQSEYFILLASPKSANSKWVRKEIDYWLEHKSIDNILIVLTDGLIQWDAIQNKSVISESNALPKNLEEKLSAEPFYIDLRDLSEGKEVSLKNPIFQKEILKLAAQLHGKAPKDLASEEINAQRKWKVIRIVAFVVLAALLGFSLERTHQATINEQEAEIQRDSAKQQTIIAKKQTIIAQEQTKKALSSSLTASSNFYKETNPTLGFRLAEYAIMYDSSSTESYSALLKSFYSNLHFYNNKLYPNTFYDQITSMLPPVSRSEDEQQFPNNFLQNKGIEIWGEYLALVKVFYSPNKQFSLFLYVPESDFAAPTLELWDLNNRYNKTDWSRTTDDDNFDQIYPMYYQNITYTQEEGLGHSNFSFDNHYLAVPKLNTANIVRVSREQENYHSRNFDVYSDDPLEFEISSSNSQVIRSSYSPTEHIVTTVNLKADTTSFNLTKMPLTTIPFMKVNLFSDIRGRYLFASKGSSVDIYNIIGEFLGEGTLNNTLDSLIKAPDIIKDFQKIRLTKVLSDKYSDSYGFGEDSIAVSKNGKFKIVKSTVTDSTGRKVLSLIGHSEEISFVDISENADLILTSTCPKIGMPEIKLWDNMGNELLTLTGFGGKVGFLPGTRAFFSYTTKCCVECDSDSNIIIWPIGKNILKKWVADNQIHKLNKEEIIQFGIDSTLLPKQLN